MQILYAFYIYSWIRIYIYIYTYFDQIFIERDTLMLVSNYWVKF